RLVSVIQQHRRDVGAFTPTSTLSHAIGALLFLQETIEVLDAPADSLIPLRTQLLAHGSLLEDPAEFLIQLRARWQRRLRWRHDPQPRDTDGTLETCLCHRRDPGCGARCSRSVSTVAPSLSPVLASADGLQPIQHPQLVRRQGAGAAARRRATSASRSTMSWSSLSRPKSEV